MQPAAPVQVLTDPYQIFARARQAWMAQSYPAMVEYTVVVRVVEGGRLKVERYRAGYDGESGTIVFDAVSDEEAAHPVHVHGINVAIPGLTNLSPPPAPIDYLGVPILAPNY